MSRARPRAGRAEAVLSWGVKRKWEESPAFQNWSQQEWEVLSGDMGVAPGLQILRVEQATWNCVHKTATLRGAIRP